MSEWWLTARSSNPQNLNHVVLWFWFSPMRFVGLERKLQSCNRLLVLKLPQGAATEICSTKKFFSKIAVWQFISWMQNSFKIFAQKFKLSKVVVLLLKIEIFLRFQKPLWNAYFKEHYFMFKLIKIRGSRSKVFFKIDALQNFAIFTGKYLRWSIFFNKVARLKPETLLKKKFQQRSCPTNIAKFSRTAFFIEQLRWLLL